MNAKKILATLLTLEEFKALKQGEMVAQLRKDFPEQARGKGRARKEQLVDAYFAGIHELGHQLYDEQNEENREKLDKAYEDLGAQTNAPEPPSESPYPTPVEMPAPAEEPAPVETSVKLPVREHAGLRFVVYEGNPNREVTRKEIGLLERVAKLIPKLGPKLQTAEFGTPGRRIIDPHKRDRQEVKRLLRHLKWARIHVLPPEKEGDVKPEKAPPRVLSENM